MKSVSILVKPASSNCNIDCSYCFYKVLSSNREQYSYGFMEIETLETLIKNAIDYTDEYLTFAFQGGEPTLCGIEFFEKAVELEKKYNYKNLYIENTIQTNGFLIDEKWAEFFARNNFLVGLSIDGPEAIHDNYRKSVSGSGTYKRIMESVELLKSYNVPFNGLCVVTENSAKQADEVYSFFKENGFSFLQFIPCMDEEIRQCKTSNTAAVTPESYGKFLCRVFDLWYQDYMSGQNIEVRMFTNLAQIAAGYPCEECGMDGKCSCYFVVEGNGNVYPCDFYSFDEWKIGTVDDSFSELINSPKVQSFLQAARPIQPEALKKCTECQYFRLCKGGCRRWREQSLQGGKIYGDNYLCQSYKMFFEHCQERIQNLGQMIINRFGEYRG